ncbi:MAG TPA: winged helix-turn-helix domain-containing protein [bacterium]|jgi:DNA-binding transcriptional ArsR family regulator|nr:winged helix-turn-helix domain-containing protein [bacterium]HOG38172.1 winged helix-turn-helix domain-containing protein [bacterium]HQI03392.1 winged helix-turn-helix domain-containing protein [bacterium]
MLDRLFGSKTRVKILRLFFAKQDSMFFVREITRELGEQINSVRRELENLEKIGLLKYEEKNNKKFYYINKNFILFEELRNIIIKSRVLLEKEYIRRLKRLDGVKYLALTGYFVDLKDETLTDMIIVGKINKSIIEKIVDQMSSEFMVDLNYTLMDQKEFNYRCGMTDRFLYNILKNKKIVIIDKIKSEK